VLAVSAAMGLAGIMVLESIVAQEWAVAACLSTLHFFIASTSLLGLLRPGLDMVTNRQNRVVIMVSRSVE
jgi:hypothetical protein